MNDFTSWLAAQADRSDAVGDLARDVRADPGAPTGDASALRSYVARAFPAYSSGVDDALAALDRAESEYEAVPSGWAGVEA